MHPPPPSMCRVYVYLLRATPPDPLTTHFVRQAQLSWRLRRLAFVKYIVGCEHTEPPVAHQCTVSGRPCKVTSHWHSVLQTLLMQDVT